MKKSQLMKLLGKFPTKVNPRVKTLEKKDCGKYIREKIEYSVEKGERIRAYILMPKNIKKAPAIFCHHQHAGNWELGKSEVVGIKGDRNQAVAVELAERGYITFAPDCIGFEERNSANGGRGRHPQMCRP